MTFDAHANLSLTTVLTPPSPATTGLSLTLAVGHGAFQPAPPFNATLWAPGTQPSIPLGTAEIYRVTGKTGDVLTGVRAQGGSSALPVAAGWYFANTIDRAAIEAIEAAVTATAGPPSSANNGKTLYTRSGAFVWDYPPGTELDYVEFTGGTLNIPIVTAHADLGDNKATGFIQGNSVTYDGSTRVNLQLSVTATEPDHRQSVVFSLYEGVGDSPTTMLGHITDTSTGVTADGASSRDAWTTFGSTIFTPTAGAHVYQIRAWVDSDANPIVQNNRVYGYPRASKTWLPCYYRIVTAPLHS